MSGHYIWSDSEKWKIFPKLSMLPLLTLSTGFNHYCNTHICTSLLQYTHMYIVTAIHSYVYHYCYRHIHISLLQYTHNYVYQYCNTDICISKLQYTHMYIITAIPTYVYYYCNAHICICLQLYCTNISNKDEKKYRSSQ